MNTKRIHVVHIIQSLGYGGAERFVVDMCNHSDPAQFRFTIITFFPRHQLAAQLTGDTQLICVPKTNKFGWGLVGALQNKLAELKPNIVHTHLFAAEWWGRAAAHSARVPVVSTLHNLDIADGWWRNTLKRITASRTQRYVAASEAIKQYAVRTFGLKPHSVAVVRYGIDVALYTKCVQPMFGEPIKILMLGRFTKQKNPLLALRALAHMQNMSWQLSVVGEGDLQEDIEKTILKLGLTSKVSVGKPTAAIAELLGKHDMLIMPSRWEGLGIVALEAMAAGRPVVASRTGGLVEIIKDGTTGFLVEPGSELELANRLAWCFKHTAEMKEMSARATQFAREHFGLQNMVSAYAEVYWSVLGRASAQSILKRG